MREPYAELGLWKTTAPGISVYLSPQGMTALLFFHVITTVEGHQDSSTSYLR